MEKKQMDMRDMWEARLTRLCVARLVGWERKVSRVALSFQACMPVLTTNQGSREHRNGPGLEGRFCFRKAESEVP